MIEPQKWASTLGSLSDTVALPDEDLQFASFKKLFPALTQVPLSEGGVAPQRTDFNTLFKLLGDNIFYIQQGGVFSYSDTADYERGAFVKYNNELYLCIQDNSSLNQHAPTDAKYWLRVALNNDLANYLPLAGGNITGNLKLKNKNVATEDFVKTSINNLNTIRKNYGNDYYDDSDITSLIYAGNGAGTIRNEVANGNFSRVHPGQTIRGKVTGTTYIVVGCNIYLHRGDTELTRNHIGLMPIQLVGNTGNLLWSGRTYAGSGVNNTTQGYAPWASDNNTEGKNQTSCYKDSYIANTVLPKVDNLWLKPDFENQGISVLTFRNLEAISFDTNATCMSNPNWRGCATNWGWTSRRLVLPSEPEIYGHYHWAGSPWESGTQHTQLPLYRQKEIHKVYPRVDIWLKDSASASLACHVHNVGVARAIYASAALRVCPLFLIA